MPIDTKTITELRAKTGAGMMDCRKVLLEANGDFDKAMEMLRKKGQKVAANRGDRATSEGLIHAYVHANGRVGALIEVGCETDFAARSDAFKDLVHDLAMQIVATNPLYLTPNDVPAEVLEKEKEIYREEMAGSVKAEFAEKALEGKISKYFEEVCLLKQKFIKEDKKTIADLIDEIMGKIGEKIEIKRFVRFEI